MTDTTIMKVDSHYSPHGSRGEKYLASGKGISMRLWESLTPHTQKTPSVRNYETVGYVLHGSAKLHIDDQIITLHEGDSWVVPKDAPHTYEIIEPFTAIEATSPPSQVHGRDHN